MTLSQTLIWSGPRPHRRMKWGQKGIYNLEMMLGTGPSRKAYVRWVMWSKCLHPFIFPLPHKMSLIIKINLLIYSNLNQKFKYRSNEIATSRKAYVRWVMWSKCLHPFIFLLPHKMPLIIKIKMSSYSNLHQQEHHPNQKITQTTQQVSHPNEKGQR